MIAVHYVHLPEWLSLVVILLSLVAGIVPSLITEHKDKRG